MDYEIIRFEGKVIGISTPKGNCPIDPLNTDFIEWRKENPDVDLSDEPYEKPYQEKRRIDYELEACDRTNMIIALWEYVVENRPEAMSELQAKRLAVKQKYPKQTEG